MVKEIFFITPITYFKHYINDEGPISGISSLAQVNLFVGANNSGKSRLLRGLVRELYDYQNYDHPGVNDFVDAVERISLLQIENKEIYRQMGPGLVAINEAVGEQKIYHEFESVIPLKPVLNDYDLFAMYKEFKNKGRTVSGLRMQNGHTMDKGQMEVFAKACDDMVVYLRSLFLKSEKQLKVTYVPVGRSIRKSYVLKKDSANELPLNFQFDDLEEVAGGYLTLRTLLDYFTKEAKEKNSGGEQRIEREIHPNCVFSGQDMYKLIYKLQKAPKTKRGVLRDFEQFLSEKFFNGQHVEITSVDDSDGDVRTNEVHITIGDDEEFPIYQLGDGIQAIILLVFPLFLNKDKPEHFVFFEEPELYLHPGMQRIFMETLLSFKNVQAFIATHSNHLLEASVDFPDSISIFSLEKSIVENQTSFKLSMRSSPGAALLNLLGVRNSSVFLSNCTIWVEGISDRLYIRRFLALYATHLNKHITDFKEDLHYSFLEFGGNNIVHYDFADTVVDSGLINARKITNRVLLIHDADKGKEKRHEHLTDQLGDDYIKLPANEMENLIKQTVLHKVLNVYRVADTDELVFNDISQEQYLSLPFSNVVNRIVQQGQFKKIFSEGSEKVVARIYDKAGFARTVIGQIQTWEDLSKEAQELTKQVYTFIRKHNIIAP